MTTVFGTTLVDHHLSPTFSFKGLQSGKTPNIESVSTVYRTEDPENHNLFSGRYPRLGQIRECPTPWGYLTVQFFNQALDISVPAGL